MTSNFRKTRTISILLIFLYFCLHDIGTFSQERAENPNNTDEERAVLVKIQHQLNQTMLITVQRAIKAAKATKADTLIIEIDTPGGEIELMRRLRDKIVDASNKDGLNTVSFINTTADSAGALIAMACNDLYMSPLAHIGSATPVAINPLGPLAPMLPMPQGQEDMMKKIKSSTRAIFKATAIEGGRNSDIAEAMVDPDIELVLAKVDNEIKVITRIDYHREMKRLGESKVEEIEIVCPHGNLLNMTARDAMDWGFIDGIPNSREELLTEFLDIPSENLSVIEPSWSENMVRHLESYTFILLIAGLILLYVEFQIPGFGIPGILGLSCLAILFFGKWLIGLAEFTELIMIILGMGLIAVEIFLIPGTFIAGIAGAILIGVGMLLAFQPFILPEEPWESQMLIDNITYFSGSLIVVFVLCLILSRYLPRTSIFQRLALQSSAKPGALRGTAGSVDDVKPQMVLHGGGRGVGQSTLRPSGKVLIQNTQIDAQSEGGFIEKDEEVEIIRITGNFIFVRRFKENK